MLDAAVEGAPGRRRGGEELGGDAGEGLSATTHVHARV